MKLGMIVRADFGRGLAEQTRSFYKHLKPDVTVVVDNALLDPRGKWQQDFSAYPDAIITRWAGYTAPFKNKNALEALAECDVVYTAETYYDERIPKLTKTVLHVNPEFFRNQPATQHWYPTVWRNEILPPGHLIPTPIEEDWIVRDLPDSNRILHVGGHRAAGDRNGTHLIAGVVHQVRADWRLASQDGWKLSPRAMAYTETLPAQDDRKALYDGCGILVAPRKYGGQSLVVNEAMARGLAVLMPDCSPNIETWPIIPVPSRPEGYVATPAGRIRMHTMLTNPLTQTIKALLRDTEMLQRWQARSIMWARENSWEEWLPKIRGLLNEC